MLCQASIILHLWYSDKIKTLLSRNLLVSRRYMNINKKRSYRVKSTEVKNKQDVLRAYKWWIRWTNFQWAGDTWGWPWRTNQIFRHRERKPHTQKWCVREYRKFHVKCFKQPVLGSLGRNARLWNVIGT